MTKILVIHSQCVNHLNVNVSFKNAKALRCAVDFCLKKCIFAQRLRLLLTCSYFRECFMPKYSGFGMDF